MKLIELLRANRAELQTRMDAAITAVETRLTADPAAKMSQEEFDAVKALRAEADELDERIAGLLAIEEARQNAVNADLDEARRRTTTTVSVTREERTYRQGSRSSFFADAYGSRFGDDFQARERLQRHAQECRVEGEDAERRDDGESRAVTTTQFGGLVIPVYLPEMFAAILRNGRGFANACNRMIKLPDSGLSVIIPRGNTGVTVAPQATQNTAASNTDLDYNTDLTIPVRTVAGAQDVSRQSLERGYPGIDEIIYMDLVAAYAARLDSSVINDDGTAGTHKGVRSAAGIATVTYTDATPTVPEAYPKFADAVQRIGTNRKLPAQLWTMHPRRWGWLLASLDSQSRPLIVPDAFAAYNAMGDAQMSKFGEGQLVGMLQGLPVLVDANIPTTVGAGTEDVVLGNRMDDLYLMEEGDGMPRRFRFDDVGSANLTVKLLVYAYSAFSAERYGAATSLVTGTGLIAPTF